MTAPSFVVPVGALGPDIGIGSGTVTLSGPEGHHAADVHRLGPGEAVRLIDGAGWVAEGTVEATRKGELDVRVDHVSLEDAPPVRLVLVQALAKGDRDLMAVETATELDVDEIVPWQADRSIVRWRAERGDKARRKWEQQVLAATKQSRRTRLPVVAPLADRVALVERARDADLALVLHEDATTPVTGVDLPELDTDAASAGGQAPEVLLVVGPEGGIAPAELDALVGVGAVPVRLGRTVLRTSTAGGAALAALHTRWGWR